VVHVAPHASLKQGEFAEVRITAADTHDLEGRVAAKR
jgi:methionine-rich copper-binding protein CopC